MMDQKQRDLDRKMRFCTIFAAIGTTLLCLGAAVGINSIIFSGVGVITPWEADYVRWDFALPLCLSGLPFILIAAWGFVWLTCGENDAPHIQ